MRAVTWSSARAFSGCSVARRPGRVLHMGTVFVASHGRIAPTEGCRAARVPPMDYRHKSPCRGVNFGRRPGVNIQCRLTGYGYQHGAEGWLPGSWEPATNRPSPSCSRSTNAISHPRGPERMVTTCSLSRKNSVSDTGDTGRLQGSEAAIKLRSMHRPVLSH